MILFVRCQLFSTFIYDPYFFFLRSVSDAVFAADRDNELNASAVQVGSASGIARFFGQLSDICVEILKMGFSTHLFFVQHSRLCLLCLSDGIWLEQTADFALLELNKTKNQILQLLCL
jgi:hypothetical protein